MNLLMQQGICVLGLEVSEGKTVIGELLPGNRQLSHDSCCHQLHREFSIPESTVGEVLKCRQWPVVADVESTSWSQEVSHVVSQSDQPTYEETVCSL